MSKFFSVTLNKDFTLNDEAISKDTVWSSEHTLEQINASSKNVIDDEGELGLEKTWSNQHISEVIDEKTQEKINDDLVDNEHTWSGNHILGVIVNNRIIRFDSLSDVDVVNKKDKQVVIYSESLQKFITADLSAVGGGGGLNLKQLSKMAITGTLTSPQIVDIPIETIDFKVPKVNVLKLMLGDQNVIKTAASFTNGESNDFVSDDMVAFDGKAHLKSNFNYNMTKQSSTIGSYQPYSIDFDNIFKSVNNLSISDSSDGTKVLNVDATPSDRLLIPKGDLNLSNANSVDFFNVTATGAKIVCSPDSGVTWKTFQSNNWVDIGLNIDEVKANGIDISDFNAIPSVFWNMLITSHKVRFAYLLQDSNSIDELTVQYDCPGYWVEAKNTEYDVIYASNSLMQIKLYISGDVKINY